MLSNKEMGCLRLGLVLAGVAGLTVSGAQAQGLGNSPYSRIGLGEFNANTGGVRQMGMGGVGLAAPNAVNVNELNPAMLYYTSRTTFEAGYNGQYKTAKNANGSIRSGSGTLGYLALSVPLSSKWGAAVGLKPLSSVDYESNTIQGVRNDPTTQVLTQAKGEGGVSEAYLGQGFRITKNFTLGFTASYVFGVIDETSSTTLQVANTSTALQETAVDRTHIRYSDFGFRAGAHYRHKLGKELSVNLAGVYGFAHDLRGTRDVTQERQDAAGAVSASTTVSDGRGSTYVPALAQVGISFDNDKNWSANFDASHQQWSKFRSFGETGVPLSNTLRLGLGGEITPDPGSVEHYFQRVTYRAGLSFAQLPYQPGGKALYDRAVSWGFAFPLPTATPLEATTFSLAFIYGVRGNTDVLNAATGTSNVQESYIRGQLGITLNNRWFIKRRLQ
ncbi:MAG TPA: hypothetical protein VF629_22935 [Hymenobacter sp.]|jgi:long-subunit fatty acid transport protein|uniref:hypothetical protein n=1 Tax=Hymenobacter sp. TaxID=1898978 RepID=UPI002EDA3EEF